MINKLGRSGGIRTHGLFHPMEARYQLRYAPNTCEGPGLPDSIGTRYQLRYARTSANYSPSGIGLKPKPAAYFGGTMTGMRSYCT